MFLKQLSALKSKSLMPLYRAFSTKSEVSTMIPVGTPLSVIVAGKIIKTEQGTWGYSSGNLGVDHDVHSRKLVDENDAAVQAE